MFLLIANVSKKILKIDLKNRPNGKCCFCAAKCFESQGAHCKTKQCLWSGDDMIDKHFCDFCLVESVQKQISLLKNLSHLVSLRFVFVPEWLVSALFIGDFADAA